MDKTTRPSSEAMGSSFGFSVEHDDRSDSAALEARLNRLRLMGHPAELAQAILKELAENGEAVANGRSDPFQVLANRLDVSVLVLKPALELLYRRGAIAPRRVKNKIVAISIVAEPQTPVRITQPIQRRVPTPPPPPRQARARQARQEGTEQASHDPVNRKHSNLSEGVTLVATTASDLETGTGAVPREPVPPTLAVVHDPALEREDSLIDLDLGEIDDSVEPQVNGPTVDELLDSLDRELTRRDDKLETDDERIEIDVNSVEAGAPAAEDETRVLTSVLLDDTAAVDLSDPSNTEDDAHPTDHLAELDHQRIKELGPMMRHRLAILAQSLKSRPGYTWDNVTGQMISLAMPTETPMSATYANRLVTQSCLAGVLEQQVDGRIRRWLKLTPAGLDWLDHYDDMSAPKHSAMPKATTPIATEPTKAESERARPATQPSPDIEVELDHERIQSLEFRFRQRLRTLASILATRENHTWFEPTAQLLAEAMPPDQSVNTDYVNKLITEGCLCGILEQDMNGRRRRWVRATLDGVAWAHQPVELPIVPTKSTAPPPASSGGLAHTYISPNVRRLKLAEGFELGIEGVAMRMAIMGASGAGKTSTAWVMAEEMIANGEPVAIIDPSGVWWGLRSSPDGEEPGLPVIIFGGDGGHADVPLRPGDGRTLAEFFVRERRSIVLDISDFDEDDQMAFCAAFYEGVYVLKRTDYRPQHIITDEADIIAPQNTLAGKDVRLRDAGQSSRKWAMRIAKKGRMRGIGQTWITQRPAEFTKGVLAQIEVLIALRFMEPRDTGVIKEWFAAHGSQAEVRQVTSQLHKLLTGEVMFYAPGWIGQLCKVQIRQRATFDSTATPIPGVEFIVPKVFAEVDLTIVEDYLPGRIEAGFELLDDEDTDDESVETTTHVEDDEDIFTDDPSSPSEASISRPSDGASYDTIAVLTAQLSELTVEVARLTLSEVKQRRKRDKAEGRLEEQRRITRQSADELARAKDEIRQLNQEVATLQVAKTRLEASVAITESRAGNRP